MFLLLCKPSWSLNCEQPFVSWMIFTMPMAKARLKLLIRLEQVLLVTLSFSVTDVDGLDHAHGLWQDVLGLSCVSNTVTMCCLVDFHVDGLDHNHGLEQVVLGLDGVSETFDPSWTSFITDKLWFGEL